MKYRERKNRKGSATPDLLGRPNRRRARPTIGTSAETQVTLWSNVEPIPLGAGMTLRDASEVFLFSCEIQREKSDSPWMSVE